ncbi:MAG TPA: bifunctional 4-hydroxy-2-oxoglutarate aldolase/2-dehydro-3-deoxy-phosphogluconate aldolase [Verrucomicrobiae bacterium]|nr:bifunctional 4-hydroxy-2-oxoglutarate aldolase/2-dehydro-3-deoxy-phosphogluconate aldolase [Verrucomicrobiae bacterium]
MKISIASKHDIMSTIAAPGIIAVIRARSRAQVLPISEALIKGGVIAIEITMTTPDAIEAIAEARRCFEGCALIGVGTVLDVGTCKAALGAGAQFVVTPVCRPEFVSIAQQADKPIMLGAYTPTEAQLAHESGADYVKIFPADTLGPGYMKSLLAPLPHLRLVPTGGVDVNNVADFFKAGCAAVGVGSSLVSAKILDTSDWPALTRKAAEFVQNARGEHPRP